VRAGEGTLGKLLNDDAIFQNASKAAKQIEKVLGNLNQSSTDVKNLIARFQSSGIPEDLERTARNVGDTSERIKTLVASFQSVPGGGEGIAKDLRATLSSSCEAMEDLAEDLEALKHGFFFRGFFKDRGFYDLGNLTITEYQSKEFEKQVTKERVWIRQSDLFEIDANGAESLSDAGKKRLDSLMTDFLRFTNDRAVIVEGYAAGAGADQFLRSRDRATKVRSYLIEMFTLNPGYIGVMPMGSAGGIGDGISLVLLKK
jgi:phospholipid/cholesterol/gamma-HCH transport system substrate-binding protein